jgi:hypothetical protein
LPDFTHPGAPGSKTNRFDATCASFKKTLRAINARAPGLFHGADSATYSDFVKKTIQFAVDDSTETDKVQLGQPIDIALLRKNQPIEWVSRKKECYEQDQE